jgi:hypothetical protein
MTATITRGYEPETLELIRRLERATAARARCAEQATRCAAKATLAHTPQVIGDWTDLRDEARRNRDEWDAIIHDLHRQLTRD